MHLQSKHCLFCKGKILTVSAAVLRGIYNGEQIGRLRAFILRLKVFASWLLTPCYLLIFRIK